MIDRSGKNLLLCPFYYVKMGDWLRFWICHDFMNSVSFHMNVYENLYQITISTDSIYPISHPIGNQPSNYYTNSICNICIGVFEVNVIECVTNFIWDTREKVISKIAAINHCQFRGIQTVFQKNKFRYIDEVIRKMSEYYMRKKWTHFFFLLSKLKSRKMDNERTRRKKMNDLKQSNRVERRNENEKEKERKKHNCRQNMYEIQYTLWFTTYEYEPYALIVIWFGIRNSHRQWINLIFFIVFYSFYLLLAFNIHSPICWSYMLQTLFFLPLLRICSAFQNCITMFKLSESSRFSRN